jgi:hypothetical protein
MVLLNCDLLRPLARKIQRQAPVPTMPARFLRRQCGEPSVCEQKYSVPSQAIRDTVGDTVVSAGRKGGLLTLVERKTKLIKIAAKVERSLNARPRKSLDFRSPQEVFHSSLTLKFLSDGRSKGSGVSLDMAAVAQG